MEDLKAHSTNDLEAPVGKFCLALETDRRAGEGRVRNEKEFREHFFPFDDSGATDRILKYLPREVRGPIIATWGIRGQKAAMRDDDGRVRSVVHDALLAGDINDELFETGFSPETVVGWVKLSDWWAFWRGGRQTKATIQRALELGFELGLFDASWFFDALESGGGKLRGTDVLVEGMSKTELADWIKKIHESGDGSPNGLLSALGWPIIVAKTNTAVLLSIVDAFAKKSDLVAGGAGDVVSVASTAAIADPPPAHAEAPAEEEDDLLRGLDGKSEGEDNDWLENPIAVAPDDDVVDDGGLGPAIDGNDVTTIFQEGEHGAAGHAEGDEQPRKGLPGLPSSVMRKSKIPPPMDSGNKGRKH